MAGPFKICHEPNKPPQQLVQEVYWGRVKEQKVVVSEWGHERGRQIERTGEKRGERQGRAL